MGCRNTRFIRHGVVVAVALATLIVTALTGGAGGTAMADPAHASVSHAATANRPMGCDVWQIVQSPNSSLYPNSRLLGVSAFSPAAAWSVGLTFLLGDKAHTLTEQWRHGAWQIVASPNPANTFQSVLNGVAMVSPQDVWAVGTNAFITQGLTLQTDTLIEHWNGKQWSIVPSPNPSTVSNRLTSVAAITANDVWAVGDYQSAENLELPLTEHWDGHAWHVVASAPLPDSISGTFAAVTAIPGSKQLLAVGQTLTFPRPSFEQALIEHWDGRQWHLIVSGSPAGFRSSELLGVAALSRTDAWTVGDATAEGGERREPLVLHWSGSVWQAVPSPLPSFASGGLLLAVAATKAHDVRVIGSFFAPDASVGEPWFQRWDGRQWHLAPSPVPQGVTSTGVNALAADRAGSFWAVGDSISGTENPEFSTFTEHSFKCA